MSRCTGHGSRNCRFFNIDTNFTGDMAENLLQKYSQDISNSEFNPNDTYAEMAKDMGGPLCSYRINLIN